MYRVLILLENDFPKYVSVEFWKYYLTKKKNYLFQINTGTGTVVSKNNNFISREEKMTQIGTVLITN